MLAAPPVPADLMPTQAPPAQLASPASFVPPSPMFAAPARPMMPSEQDFRPSSIAPFAVDTLENIPARRPSLIVESTAELARAAGVPSRTTWQTVAGIAGAIALSTLALGLVGYGVTHRMKTRTATVVVDEQAAIARTPSIEEKRAAIIPPPPPAAPPEPPAAAPAPVPQETNVVLTAEPVPQSKPQPIGATPVSAPPPPARHATPESAAPVAQAPRPSQNVVAAPAPRTTQTAPKSSGTAPRAGAQQTGTLRVSTPAVLIDGAPKKVVNGAVTVACGKHTVKAPMRAAKTVDVPCGGTASY
jgi:hypothetical protein